MHPLMVKFVGSVVRWGLTIGGVWLAKKGLDVGLTDPETLAGAAATVTALVLSFMEKAGVSVAVVRK